MLSVGLELRIEMEIGFAELLLWSAAPCGLSPCELAFEQSPIERARNVGNPQRNAANPMETNSALSPKKAHLLMESRCFS